MLTFALEPNQGRLTLNLRTYIVTASRPSGCPFCGFCVCCCGLVGNHGLFSSGGDACRSRCAAASEMADVSVRSSRRSSWLSVLPNSVPPGRSMVQRSELLTRIPCPGFFDVGTLARSLAPFQGYAEALRLGAVWCNRRAGHTNRWRPWVGAFSVACLPASRDCGVGTLFRGLG